MLSRRFNGRTETAWRQAGKDTYGTDQRLGVSFDQQDGSAVGGWTEYGVIGAYAHTARHAVKCAEWCRTQDVAWRSWPRTGRAGVRASVSRAWLDGATANSLAADRHGPRQDGQTVKTKLLAGGAACGFWIRAWATRARSSSNRPLEPPCYDGRACSRVGWTSPANHARNATHFAIERPLGR